MYDYNKIKQDEEKGPCIGLLAPRETVILSHTNEGECVGIAGDYAPGNFLVLRMSGKCTVFPREHSEITISGSKALKYPFTENSPGPHPIATDIYIDHNEDCFFIQFVQTDKNGSHDPLYDKILSTFRFID